ncbi:VIR protein [Plasmodium vivax]|uniref:VIR protein n=1 Tax=Plasmodium vivax TaxID=5855 RepID=A0A1G4HDQ6_PLAVI|nr:VIR protein [Plasmodium vivax]VUZ99416.1 PIR protein [Plasmodium vivax]
MPQNILDISKWKTDYPFLQEVWKMYDEFEKPVEINQENNKYILLCHTFMNGLNESKEEYKIFCNKLARNLGLYSEDTRFTKPSHDRCNILYNWIYNSIKKHHIPDNIIKECFEEYDRITKATGNIKCSYYTYDNDYKEPENIMLLNVFISYIGDTKNTMNGENEDLKRSCHKYICEFVKIYKRMYSEYCLRESPNYQKQQKTCEHLGYFKQNYDIFLFNQLKEKDKIPSLEKVEEEYMLKCQKYDQRPALQTEVRREQTRFAHLSEGTRESPHIFPSETTVSNNDAKNPISSTVSTAVGTVAGASSILVLLYKFTPGRKWIHSGFGGGRRERINSNFYDPEHSELLFDGQVHGDYGSYNQRYDIGYSPM